MASSKVVIEHLEAIADQIWQNVRLLDEVYNLLDDINTDQEFPISEEMRNRIADMMKKLED